MKTIAKNRTATINGIFARVIKCEEHTRGGQYAAQPCPSAYARKQLDRFAFAKLIDKGDHYTVKVDNTEWYDLFCHAEAEPEYRPGAMYPLPQDMNEDQYRELMANYD
jgi:hypothetical protein